MNLKLKKKALRRLLLITCLVFSGPTFALDPRILEANFCQKVLGGLMTSVAFLADPIAAIKFKRVAFEERQIWAAKSEISDFHTIEDFLATQDKYCPQSEAKGWMPTEMGFPVVGSIYLAEGTRGPISVLENYLKSAVPAPYSGIALKVKSALTDYNRILVWLKEINNEVLHEMWDNNFRKKSDLSNNIIREYFLDRVLARRAQAKGFKIKSDGLPYDLFFESSFTFNKTLAAGQFFVDWSGITIAAHPNKGHYARGHSLAMAYLADNVENFVDLIQFIGRTNDRHGMWGLMFDNTKSYETPFWGGYWIVNFSLYLAIQK